MKFIPNRRLVIESPLSATEVVNRLLMRVEGSRWGSPRPDHGFFEGWVEGNEFAVDHIIDYSEASRDWNSQWQRTFQPHVTGRVDSLPDGRSRISGHLRIRISAYAFIVLLVAIGTMLPLVMLLGRPANWNGLFPALVPMVFLGLMRRYFKAGAATAMNELAEITESTKPAWV